MKKRFQSLSSVLSNYRYLLNKLYQCDHRLYRVCFVMIAAGLIIPLSNVILPKLLIWATLWEAPSLAMILGIILLFFVLSSLCNGFNNYYLRRNGVYLTNFGFKLKEDIQEISMTMPFPMTEDSGVLDRIKLAKGCISQVQSIVETFCRCISAIVLLVGYTALIVRLNLLILPVFAACVLLDALAVRRMEQKLVEKRQPVANADRKKDYLFRTMFDYRFGKDLRLFRLEEMITEKFTRQRDEKYKLNREMEGKRFAAQTVGAVLRLVCEASVYLFLLAAYLNKGLQVDDFVLYTGLTASFQTISRGLTADLGQLFRMNISIGDYRGFVEGNLSQPETSASGKAEGRQITGGGEIRFENVSFHYPGTERDVLCGLSLTIEAGSHVSLVGLNGAGKSTIVKLICRLYRPTAGNIYLDGQNIWDCSLEEYRKRLSAVFQESRLFACSLAENIAMEEGSAVDDRRMWEALRAVDMEEKVLRLPQKEQTNILKYLYDDGVEFSGGETQRLCIARAVYKQGDVLLLDEPTAALDALAEKSIYESFSQVSRGKTTLFISHRLNSNRFCDKVVFLENGRAAAEGSHEQLLESYPPYRELYEMQAKNYKLKEGAAV